MGNHERTVGIVGYEHMSEDELYYLLEQRRLDVATVAEKVDDFNRHKVIAFLRVW
jgi:hypothetical protein